MGRPKKEILPNPERDDPMLPESMLVPVPKEQFVVTSSEEFMPNDPLLETSLSQTVESENTIKSVSKELFTHSNIDVKTEVSHDEINNLTRLRFLRDRFNVQNVDTLTQSFLALRVSKDRKSRREFIEALQSENRSSQGGNFLSKMFGGGGGGGNQ
jgi:hypothetical protein